MTYDSFLKLASKLLEKELMWSIQIGKKYLVDEQGNKYLEIPHKRGVSNTNFKSYDRLDDSIKVELKKLADELSGRGYLKRFLGEEWQE